MAATTITNKSQQLTQVDAVAHQPLKTNEMSGRVRVGWFEWNSTDEGGGTHAAGQSAALVRLPSGARILGIEFSGDGLGTTIDADMGLAGADGNGFIDAAGSVSDDTDYFTSAVVDVSSAGSFQAANSVANNMGATIDKECYLTLTLLDGGSYSLGADKNLNGYVLYVVD